MSAWTEYVKQNYHLVKHLPNKERLKALSQMYKGGSVPHGGGMMEKPKKGGKRGKRVVKGGDFIQDAYDTVKGYTSKGAKIAGSAKRIADKASQLANLADTGTDVALKGARAVQRGIDSAKETVGRMIDEAKYGIGADLGSIFLS
jgi:hypothetical protein